jgi:Amt family ammonium transporter
MRLLPLALGATFLFCLPHTAFAATASDSGDTAWILTATALVLMMTLPGLALFYAGLVQAKNVVSVLMHHFAVACLMSILWVVAGYSLAFSGDGAWVGNLGNMFLSGLDFDSISGSIPESVFAAFQMTFAIITPALIIGAFVERMKFAAILWFSALWLLLVYAPVTHWVWGGGIMAAWGVMDFAGGIVVHATAGSAALVCALIVGKRRNFPQSVNPPHSPILTMIGASMLWIGWFGFNGGSALAAGNSAGMALLVTHIAAATASLVWMGIEWFRFGRPSLVGIVTGMVAGLATVTPASGFIGVPGGLILGLAGGVACYIAVDILRVRMKIDDSLDVFAVHGVGGIIGSLLVAWLALPSFGGLGLADGGSATSQFGVQFLSVAITVGWTVVASVVILKVIGAVIGLRVDQQDEIEGLDLSQHGERGYHSH